MKAPGRFACGVSCLAAGLLLVLPAHGQPAKDSLAARSVLEWRAKLDSTRAGWKVHKEKRGSRAYRKPGEILVVWQDTASARKWKAGNFRRMRIARAQDEYALVAFDEGALTLEQAAAELRLSHGARFAEPNLIFERAGRNLSVGALNEARLGRLRKSASKGRKRRDPLRIGIFDTGIEPGHAAFQGWLGRGYDAFTQKPIPTDKELPAGDTARFDRNGHGTMVAGILAGTLAAVADSGADISLHPIRVLDEYGFGTLETVYLGVKWAAKQGIDLANFSLSGSEGSPLLAAALAQAQARGMVCVASAGNEFSTEARYPAAFPGVISVGSADESGRISSFSNRGPDVDVFTSGELWDTPVKDGSRDASIVFSGTSSAAAFVSGMVGLALLQDAGAGAVQGMLAASSLDVRHEANPDSSAVPLLKPESFLARVNGLNQPSLGFAAYSLARDGRKIRATFRVSNLGTAKSPADTLFAFATWQERRYWVPVGLIPGLEPGASHSGEALVDTGDFMPQEFLGEEDWKSISLQLSIGSGERWTSGALGLDFAPRPKSRLTVLSMWVTPQDFSGIRKDRMVFAKLKNEGDAILDSAYLLPYYWHGVHEAVGVADTTVIGAIQAVASLRPGEIRVVALPAPEMDSLPREFTVALQFTGAGLEPFTYLQAHSVAPNGTFQANYAQEVHRDIVRKAKDLLDALGLRIPDLSEESPVDYLGRTSNYRDWGALPTTSMQATIWTDNVISQFGITPTAVHGAHDCDGNDVVYGYTFEDTWDSHFWIVDNHDDDGLNSNGSNHHSALSKMRVLVNSGSGSLGTHYGALWHYAQGHKRGAWYLLGHALHLIGDMSLGSHTNDENSHGMPGVGDVYHQFMDYGLYSAYNNIKTAILDKGHRYIDPYQAAALGDPVRFLAYTTAQVGNSFPRHATYETAAYDRYAGNRTAGGDAPRYEAYMNGLYAAMPNRPIGITHISKDEVWDNCPNFCCWCSRECQFVDVVGQSEDVADCNRDGHWDKDNTDLYAGGLPNNSDGDIGRIAETCYPYSIRAAAGLMYYFAFETGQYGYTSVAPVNNILF